MVVQLPSSFVLEKLFLAESTCEWEEGSVKALNNSRVLAKFLLNKKTWTHALIHIQ